MKFLILLLIGLTSFSSLAEDREVFYKVVNKPFSIDQLKDIKNWEKLKNKEKLNLGYSNSLLIFKIKNNEEKYNLFIDALSPGKIKVLDNKYNKINSYGYKDSNHKGFYPIFEIKKEKEVYVVREGNLRFDGVVSFPEESQIEKLNSFNFIILFLFLGAALMIMIYHFGLYTISKDKNYLYYVLFNSSSVFIILIFGLFFYNFLNTNFIEELLMVFAALSPFMCNVFTRKFLDLKQYISEKKYNFILYLEKLLLITAIVYILSLFYFKNLSPIFATIIDVLVLITISNASYIAYKIKSKNIIAKFYLASWGCIYIGVFFLYGYEYFNLLAEYQIIRYSLLFGYTGEMVINSLGLSYKVKMNEIRKTEALLEAKQKNRYQRLLRVLTHDISNPLTSAMTSSDFIEIDPEAKTNLEDSLVQIREIIDSVRDSEKENSLSGDGIRAREAYEILLKNFKEKFNDKSILFKFKGDENILIPINKVVFVNNILSNLVSNSIKFSFKNSEIIFHCIEEKNKIKISVEDFGAGLDEETFLKLNNGEITTSQGTENENGTGFGTQIIKSVLEDYGSKLDIIRKEKGAIFGFLLEKLN